MASSYENPARSTQYQTTKEFNNLQADVNQVVEIMKNNMEQVLDRDADIGGLVVRVDRLKDDAFIFRQEASNLQKKYWWKNVKMWAIISIIVIIVLFIVIVVAITQSSKNNNNG
ncbi:unnamed protein product [Adineta steineri]|uniref:V-SNARE coiled-coil homology domain-containing protein n=1 Tax=Adineta steineri TaxID=433720 RepID=A0A814K7G7_9BILA|nr:unnamed protein product [Adineta steineri]CAF4028404.1 unnamed protein product [Adineta steineri]